MKRWGKCLRSSGWLACGILTAKKTDFPGRLGARNPGAVARSFGVREATLLNRAQGRQKPVGPGVADCQGTGNCAASIGMRRRVGVNPDLLLAKDRYMFRI